MQIYLSCHTTFSSIFNYYEIIIILWLFPRILLSLVKTRTPWHPKKVYGRIRLFVELIWSGLIKFWTSLELEKIDFQTIYKPTVQKHETWEISRSWLFLAYIFRKYFQKRNRELWNEQKRTYDEKVMIFPSLMTKNYFLKILRAVARISTDRTRC